MFKKKNNLQTAIAIACMSASLGSYAAVPAKPNVVTIMIDDMGFSDIGKFGGEIDTPNLDQLVTDGTQLTNYYSAPTSSPARAMFFTGRDAHPAGLGNMGGNVPDRPPQVGQPGYEGVLSPNLPTFPELLKANGYYTVMAGKWHLGDKPGQYPSDRGFTDSLALLPGGDVQYLSDASGNLLTTYDPSYYARMTSPTAGQAVTTPFNRNGLSVANGSFPANAFSTDYYTDEAIAFLDAHRATNPTQPFYLHVSHTASHGPFQAPDDLIQKYLPRYRQGWDKLRVARFEKLKALGLVAANAVLPPRDQEVLAWSKLTANQKSIESRRMAVYAGMVDKLDQSVGKLIQHLKDIGQYDNTVFFVMSDNGAAEVEPPFGPARESFIAANFTTAVIGNLGTMGNNHSYINPSPGLGMLSNMPFKRFKTETFEGGVHTAAFMFSPQANTTSKGAKYNCVSSVMDIPATILNLTGTPYPTTWKGTPIAPLEGKSMSGVLNAGNLTCKYPNRTLGIEMNGIKMLRSGDWKLAQQFFMNTPRSDGRFYLYNLASDPFELHNLSKTNPLDYRRMLRLYNNYALKNKVVNVGPRTFSATGNLNMTPAVTGGILLGGTQVNYASLYHNVSSTAYLGDSVDIAAEIYPPSAHQGMTGDAMVAAYYKPAVGAGEWTTFRRTPALSVVSLPNETADGSLTAPDFTLVPTFSAVHRKFTSRIELPIYEGPLDGVTTTGGPSFKAGTYYFWTAYKLSDGTLEKSVNPIVLTVTP